MNENCVAFLGKLFANFVATGEWQISVIIFKIFFNYILIIFHETFNVQKTQTFVP